MFKYLLLTILFLSCTCSAFRFGVGIEEPIGGVPIEEVVERKRVVEEDSTDDTIYVEKMVDGTKELVEVSDSNADFYREKNVDGQKVLEKESATHAGVYTERMLDGKKILVKKSGGKKHIKRTVTTEPVVEERFVEAPRFYPSYPLEEVGFGFGFGGRRRGRHWR